MQEKTARLTILIDPKTKNAFDKLCAAEGSTTSHLVRQLIFAYLARHGDEKKTKSKR